MKIEKNYFILIFMKFIRDIYEIDQLNQTLSLRLLYRVKSTAVTGQDYCI